MAQAIQEVIQDVRNLRWLHPPLHRFWIVTVSNGVRKVRRSGYPPTNKYCAL
jgi:hypothetical protein